MSETHFGSIVYTTKQLAESEIAVYRDDVLVGLLFKGKGLRWSYIKATGERGDAVGRIYETSAHALEGMHYHGLI